MMVDLSIVIVQYNVKEFLTQCLDSIYQSKTDFSFEVIVVDNASADPGKDLILDRFPQTHWITNAQNVGFGKANNQGFEAAQGTYTLILNPDTVLKSNTIDRCVRYLQEHPEVGGLGIRGLDGSGQFLPESKRALPTPLVALWKISGLSALFPTSPLFAKYHLGHLDPKANHEVDILVGCFMMVPTSLLHEVGGFDPQYFMYGEDIDLSYELQKTGKKNVYFAESEIIHYKGESTKRGSLNYVRMFYQAMILFAKKQFSGSSAAAYSLLIYFGIYLRASLAVVARLAKSAFTPFLDAALLYVVLNATKTYWELNHRFVNGGSYPDTYTYYVQGTYVLFWILGLWLAGVYIRNNRPIVIIRSMLATTLVIGFAYGLLPEELRFSRALLVLGGLAGTALLLTYRALIALVTGKSLFERALTQPRILFYGSKEHAQVLDNLLAESRIVPSFLWHQEPIPDSRNSTLFNLVKVHRINELIIDAKSVSYDDLINILEALGSHTSVKTLLPDDGFIVGSDSSLTQGTAYRKRQQTADPHYLRQRRVFELTATLLLVLLAPVSALLALLVGRFSGWKRWFVQSGAVLAGKKSIVGYSEALAEKFKVPHLPPPIFDICSVLPSELDFLQNSQAIIEHYANEARLRTDLLHLWQLSNSNPVAD